MSIFTQLSKPVLAIASGVVGLSTGMAFGRYVVPSVNSVGKKMAGSIETAAIFSEAVAKAMAEKEIKKEEKRKKEEKKKEEKRKKEEKKEEKKGKDE